MYTLHGLISASREKKGKKGKKSRQTMIHSEAGEADKMKTHHVPLRQSVEDIRLRQVYEEGGYDESENFGC